MITSVTDGDPEHLRAKATALRLLLAQIDSNIDVLDNIEREIAPEPEDMTRVLGTLLGIAAAEVIHRHHGDKAAAAKSVETSLADALDELG